MSDVQRVIEDLQKRDLLGSVRSGSGDNVMFDCPFTQNHGGRTRGSKPHFGIRLVAAPGKSEGSWHCFSCHVGGHDIWSLWSRLTGQTVEEAKETLSSAEVLIETVLQAVKALDEEANQAPVCLTDWPAAVAIEDSPVAQDYLRGRGIPQELWQRAGLEWFGGATMPPRKDKEKSSVRGSRVIFPIEWQGRRVGYSARAVGYETDLKYYRPVLNVNAMLYDPVHLLATPDRTRVFVVEGEVDCLACIREGLPAVSTFGSSMSRSQAKALSRFKEVCFLYDQDKAGINGIKRADELFGGMLHWRAFWLPRGKDAGNMPAGWGQSVLAMANVPAPDHSLSSLEKAIKAV